MVLPLDDKRLRELSRRFSRRHGREYLFCPLLSAAIAGRDEPTARLIMETALAEKIAPRTLAEIILQIHLFVGFPAMIEAARLLADIVAPKHDRHRLPGPYTAAECRMWNRHGLVKIKRIYGDTFDRLVPYVNSFSPQILTWMINDGYGRVLSRPGASFRLRELSTVATLTVAAYENQLLAHLRGAIHAGVSPALIKSTIANCRYFCTDDHLATARNLLSRMMAA
jgi:alkylhydroperoxidase/carboxymuconolactone decarboxylase family protein YurZ